MFADLNWTAFFLAIVIVELTPGPNMGWLTALSAQSGRKIGLMAVAGITLGLTVQMLAAATGLSTLLADSSVLYEALRWSGVAFMVYLAWEAFSDTGETSPVSTGGAEGFQRGLIANLLNPKALVFYLAVIGQFANAANGAFWVQIVILGLIHIAVSVVVHTSIVLLGARLGASLDHWRTSLGVRLGFAASLLAIAIWIAISTGRPA